MKKFIQIDVVKLLPEHVVVGDCVEIVLNTHEGSVKALISDEDFRRLNRNHFFIKPNEQEMPCGVLETTETYIVE